MSNDRVFEIFKILLQTNPTYSDTFEWEKEIGGLIDFALEINKLFETKIPNNFLVERKITNSGIV